MRRNPRAQSYERGRRQGLQRGHPRFSAAASLIERSPRTEVFQGAARNRLIGDVYGNGPRAALFLHGGGQTRHAFAEAAGRLAKAGWTAVALDQRGHGDSDWCEDGAYDAADFAADGAAAAAAIEKRMAKP